MAKKNGKDMELILLIGEEVVKVLPESQLKELENTAYECLMTKTINEIRTIQNKLKKLPRLHHKYLENRYGVKPKVKEVEHAQPSFDNYVA